MEWRKNRVAIGAIAFVLLLGLTLYAANRTDRQPASSGEVPLIELDKDAITSLEITRPQDDQVVLTKGEVDWQVTEPVNATADQTNVESALNRLGDLRLARIVADRPENYERLQVDDANAVRVTAKVGDQRAADLKIGKYANGMTMVRVGDRPEVFGASGSLRYAFDRELRMWRNRKVVDVAAADVTSIRFKNSSGVFRFERDEDSWKATEGGKKLGKFDPKQVTGLLSTAARLTASDFASEKISKARAGLKRPRATVAMTIKDETPAVVLELGGATEKADGVYLRRKDDPTIYVISTYLANRLQPDAESFAPSPEPPTTPPAMPAAPQGQALPQLPPEVMRQLEEQARAREQQQR